METALAETILRSIIDNTRKQLNDYSAEYGLSLDINNIDDQEIVRSMIKSAGLDSLELENAVVTEIFAILKLDSIN